MLGIRFLKLVFAKSSLLPTEDGLWRRFYCFLSIIKIVWSFLSSHVGMTSFNVPSNNAA